VLRETMSRGRCGLVCPSRTSEREGEGYCVPVCFYYCRTYYKAVCGDCVKEGGEGERERERERALGLLLCHSLGH